MHTNFQRACAYVFVSFSHKNKNKMRKQSVKRVGTDDKKVIH